MSVLIIQTDYSVTPWLFRLLNNYKAVGLGRSESSCSVPAAVREEKSFLPPLMMKEQEEGKWDQILKARAWALAPGRTSLLLLLINIIKINIIIIQYGIILQKKYVLSTYVSAPLLSILLQTCVHRFRRCRSLLSCMLEINAPMLASLPLSIQQLHPILILNI